ncbi:MAG TPA: hypothetical protein DCG12_14540, partial [Planctomycetaceae bacterium]|nr:hypothetical protein [Planctomycetaceae bacterium]
MRFYIKLLVVLAVIGAAGFFGWQKTRDWLKERNKPNFNTAEVVQGTIRITRNATGEVKPVLSLHVGSFVSGPIEELLVDFNDEVKEGQVLAKIDPRIYKAAVASNTAALANRRAEVERVKAQLQRAINDEKRSLALAAENKDFISQTDLDQYRFSRMRGQMLSGATLNSGINDNPSWTMGVTFEVPLTLRSARASLRSSELLLARDRANIQQGLHATEHTLATTVRSLDQFYMQYKAFQESREAARINLELQDAQNRARRVIFLNVLQAITDWGNAVSSEATALTGYNSTLATLERETGTILDTHGIVFNEER